MKSNKLGNSIRKWSRILHRDLSFFFTGMILIYAISGVVMNHRDTMSPHYSVELINFTLDTKLPSVKEEITKDLVVEILKPLGEADNYTKHYFPGDSLMKVFIKGGSSLVVNRETNLAIYEKLTKRPVMSFMAKLHYNPGRWWTHFADLFAVGLVIITLSGLVMIKGSKGIWGRGGIELIIGMIIPLLFLFL